MGKLLSGMAQWLPGDFSFGGGDWRVTIPLGMSIAVSPVLTLVLNLVLWLSRRR